jgi:hypothetical protein
VSIARNAATAALAPHDHQRSRGLDHARTLREGSAGRTGSLRGTCGRLRLNPCQPPEQAARIAGRGAIGSEQQPDDHADAFGDADAPAKAVTPANDSVATGAATATGDDPAAASAAEPDPAGNGGDHDADNNGGPSDGDGNI